MGSGKTTFGRWLADRCKMEFCDTDAYIENKQGCTVKEIFAAQGEMCFRDMETQALRELCESPDGMVIAAGGGLPVREENRSLLGQLGYVVYLETSQDELVRRLSSDNTRPLLAGGGLREKIRDLMAAREGIYRETADIILNTDRCTFEQMYKNVAGAFR